MTIKPRHPEKVNKPINPIKKKPAWIRSKLTNSKEFFLTKTIVNQNNLVTVCQEANCPNITECWSKRHATFMIMGDTCTRACAFCDVKTGKPDNLDPFEPFKISNAVYKLNLKHVVITSVDRDDLEDGGSNHFFDVITTCLRFNLNTASAILTGSNASSFPGFPVLTSQKAHALVHVSPIIIKVACLLLQHSVIFGQLASWQTVTRLLLLTIVFVKKNSLLLTSLDLIQSGFFLIGFIGLLTFSGCLIIIFYYYIKGLIFFAKQKFFSN